MKDFRSALTWRDMEESEDGLHGLLEEGGYDLHVKTL